VSDRYDVDSADAELQIITPNMDPDDWGPDIAGGNYALIIGDPGAAALAIEGSPGDLRRFAQRVMSAVEHLPR
jgi:hypothetical protein